MKKLIPVLALSFLTGIVFTSCKPQEPEPNDSGFLDWQCGPCGWIYFFEVGCPEQGIEACTAWEDVPDDFVCPICGSGKEYFDPIW